MNRPTQMMKPNRQTMYTMARRADAFFHQLAEVGNHTDAEEGHQEEVTRKPVHGAGHGLADLVQFRRAQADDEQDQEGTQVTQHEAGGSGP